MQRLFDYAMFTQHYENYENHTENDCPKLNIVFSLRLIRCCNTLILYTEAHLECAEKFGLVRGGGCVCSSSVNLTVPVLHETQATKLCIYERLKTDATYH